MTIHKTPDRGPSAPRAGLALLLCLLIAAPGFAQTPPSTEPAPQGQRLSVLIIEGEGAINNIRQRTAREPIVEVQDENHKPVAGAVVVFTVLPSNGGAGASFAGSAQTAEFVTDQAGRVVATGFHPNTQAGQVQIRVTATSNGRVGAATITQTNVAPAVAPSTSSSFGGLKLLAIIGIAAGGAAVAAIVAGHGGGSHSGTGSGAGAGGSSPTSITPGAPSVGAP
jgi:hypothetical protein